MNRHIIRKTAAALFLLCALLAAKETLYYKSWIPVFSDPSWVVNAIEEAVLAIVIAALAVSVWFNKGIAVRVSAFIAMAVELSWLAGMVIINKPNTFLTAIRCSSYYFHHLLGALSFLLLFIAASVKKGSITVPCFSAVSSIAAIIGRFAARFIFFSDLKTGIYVQLSANKHELFHFTVQYELDYWPEILLYLFLALAILFWGLSQRRAKTPELAAGATSSDALDALEKLNALRQSGDITGEGFTAQKAELLKKL